MKEIDQNKHNHVLNLYNMGLINKATMDSYVAEVMKDLGVKAVEESTVKYSEGTNEKRTKTDITCMKMEAARRNLEILMKIFANFKTTDTELETLKNILNKNIAVLGEVDTI